MNPVLCRLLIAALFTFAPQLAAQSRYVVRAPEQAWRSIETAHWSVHYPARAQAFADCLVPRLEPMYRAVRDVAGYAPAPRITLVIEDAQSFDGAYASANARAPVIVLQTQPSQPGTGGWSDCATARMVHEVTHILQLSRPWTAEHPLWARALMRILPAEPGPMLLRRRAWMREGYAEHVEGVLMPVGSPYTTARADVLRLLALGERFPRYADLSATYDGQYLVGAAFIDWLAARAGGRALQQLWEAMGAADWDEVATFRRLFGGAPDILYAQFVDELTTKAKAARDRLTAAGLVRGAFVRGAGHSDAVAVSPDGGSIAMVVGTPVLRLHVWPARDTLAPPLRFPIPTGQSVSAPRFTRDGRVLVVSWETSNRGVWRPDVYEWTLATRTMRRVTHGAAVRDVDPFPDGATAAGTRCEFGICDLVRIDLTTGALRLVAAGAADRAYSRPRVAPDGRTIAATLQSGATSRIVFVDLATGAIRCADPDDGRSRYEPAFLPDGRLVVVSDASGVPNLEILDPATKSARALTRLVAAAVAPEPDPSGDGVYFLRKAPSGNELWRIPIADAAGATVSVRDSALGPAAPVPLPAPPPMGFSPEPVPAWRRYGVGPRFISVLPAFAWNAGGAAGTAALWSSDIVGRLSVMADMTLGSSATWRGAGVTAVVRALPVPLDIRVADLRAHDVRYRGASVRAQHETGIWSRRHRFEAAVAGGAATADSSSPRSRFMASATYSTLHVQVSDYYAAERLTVIGASGSTGSSRWARGVATGTLEVGRTNDRRLLELSATLGAVSTGAAAFEQFAIGGAISPPREDAALAQHLSQPFFAVGTARASRTASVSLHGVRVGPVTPYAWWGSQAGDQEGGQAVVGIVREFTDDPRRNWRVPGARLGGGLGYALGATRGPRGYLSLSFAQ